MVALLPMALTQVTFFPSPGMCVRVSGFVTFGSCLRFVGPVVKTFAKWSACPQFLSQAHDGTLAIEEMDGGTFTISNGGVSGSLIGTPIINPPQSAILGMHATNDRPVAIGGKVHQQMQHNNTFVGDPCTILVPSAL